MTARTISVSNLSRVEGEGSLHLSLREGRVERAELRIFEPPRFFEALLRGRDVEELPDIVARICGICPVAYQMSAVHAVERAFGVVVDGPLRELRRLMYCGEWIESHALHVAMLHAPDFLGYPDAIAMAADHGDQVRAALDLKKTGNGLLRLIGGREIHPVSVRPGGFHRTPAVAAVRALVPGLERARDHAVALLRWVAGFEVPELEREVEFVALRHPEEYPMNEGRLVSSAGLDIDIAEFDSVFEERQVPHSTALHAALRERGTYLVGPLARYALNFDRLPAQVQDLALEAGLGRVCRNPFRSILVRAVELVYACEEALRIATSWAAPDAPAVPTQPRAATGWGCTEAPRGICWHRYALAADGRIEQARIVPPTSQNQAAIEADLVAVASALVEHDDDRIRAACEQAIRNYDPCISCSTHFLRLSVDRG